MLVDRNLSLSIVHHERIWRADFLCAMATFGADRIMFSVDYPYSSAVPARTWLDGLPISSTDRDKITHANADRLLGL